MENKISRKQILLNSFAMGIIFLFIFKLTIGSEDLDNIVYSLRRVNIGYIFLGMLLSVLYIVGEGLGIRILLKIFHYNIPIINGVKYSFIGFFFSSITPSATGGQPMQIYRMSKDGIEVSHCSLVLLIQLMTYQFSTFTIGLIGYLAFRKTIIINNLSLKYLILIGLSIDLLGLLFIGICVFNPRVSNFLVNTLARILGSLRFIREDRKEKILSFIEAQIEDYNRSSRYILKNKLKVFLVLIVSFIDLSSLFAISYMVYRALGQAGYGLMDIVLFQGIIYIASYFIPIPGSMGVSEGNYLSVFKKLYSKDKLKTSMVLSRGISFYFLLILSCSVFILDRIFNFKLREL